MNTTEIAQNVINALSLGGLYALIALGMALIFGIMRLVNFAHGQLLMIAGYVIVFLSALHWSLVFVGTVLVVSVAAVAMERAAFRPIREATASTLLVASFAVSYGLQNLATLLFGPLPRTTDISSSLLKPLKLGSVSVSKLDVVTIAVSLVVLIALGLFLERTSLGLRMRAAAEDFQMARLVGIKANTVIATAFAISGALAAVAGFLLTAQTGTVSPTSGLTPVLVGFVSIVIGGMGSLRGAAIGGFAFGAATVAFQVALPISLRPYRDAFAYTAVILTLMFRPQGLLVPKSTRTRI